MQINIKLINPLLFYKKISIINYNIHAQCRRKFLRGLRKNQYNFLTSSTESRKFEDRG
jgi:hypothetical protein